MSMGTTSFRWESELSRSFQEHARPSLWTRRSTGKWVLAHESTCSEGRADIVWGRFEPGQSPARFREHSALLRNPTASRLLAALRQRSAQSEGDLLQRLGVTPPVLRKWLRALVEAGFVVETSAHRYRAISSHVLPVVEICAFELKLKDWRRALYQATRYRSFSHRVFVVMPSESADTAFRYQDSFRKANIGLVGHDTTGNSRVLIRPLKRQPNAGYRTIMALGMFSEPGVIVKQSRGMSQ
jgi:DNA-binding transcriptional ArsR family regulator